MHLFDLCSPGFFISNNTFFSIFTRKLQACGKLLKDLLKSFSVINGSLEDRESVRLGVIREPFFRRCWRIL